MSFLPYVYENVLLQGHKFSHDVSTGIIQMVVENFTRASEGTYTVQIHDGKAKTQSSLVLVGDGEQYTAKFTATLEKTLPLNNWVCVYFGVYFSFQSCSKGG